MLVLEFRVCVTVTLVFESSASPAQMRPSAYETATAVDKTVITNTIQTLSAVCRAETVSLLYFTREKCKQQTKAASAFQLHFHNRHMLN